MRWCKRLLEEGGGLTYQCEHDACLKVEGLGRSFDVWLDLCDRGCEMASR